VYDVLDARLHGGGVGDVHSAAPMPEPAPVTIACLPANVTVTEAPIPTLN
jgi:hypothetical protein